MPLKPGLAAVGKWPEGLASDGRSIWVAESGQRRIARVDTQANRVVETVVVGRLPVDMATGAEGNIYALVNTDKTVFARTPDGKGHKLATLRECPERFVPRPGALLVLVLPDCSSASSRVLRIDTGKGTVKASAELGRNANAIAAAGDDAWVLHSTGPIRTLDAATLQPTGSIQIDGFPWVIAASGRGVFVGGRQAQQSGWPMVVRLDPATRRETHRRLLPGDELIAAMAVSERHVVAVGLRGTIFVLSADDLAPRGQFVAQGFGDFRPQAALIMNDRLYVSTHKGQGESGTLLVFEGWQH
jgi:sugar lactone lactonase YvrE